MHALSCLHFFFFFLVCLQRDDAGRQSGSPSQEQVSLQGEQGESGHMASTAQSSKVNSLASSPDGFSMSGCSGSESQRIVSRCDRSNTDLVPMALFPALPTEIIQLILSECFYFPSEQSPRIAFEVVALLFVTFGHCRLASPNFTKS